MDVTLVPGREPAMCIGVSWVTATETRPVINPADESTIAAVPEGDAGGAPSLVDLATQGGAWRDKHRHCWF